MRNGGVHSERKPSDDHRPQSRLRTRPATVTCWRVWQPVRRARGRRRASRPPTHRPIPPRRHHVGVSCCAIRRASSSSVGACGSERARWLRSHRRECPRVADSTARARSRSDSTPQTDGSLRPSRHKPPTTTQWTRCTAMIRAASRMSVSGGQLRMPGPIVGDERVAGEDGSGREGVRLVRVHRA
jgi:hypothetical protein